MSHRYANCNSKLLSMTGDNLIYASALRENKTTSSNITWVARSAYYREILVIVRTVPSKGHKSPYSHDHKYFRCALNENRVMAKMSPSCHVRDQSG
jgi:hypothetical protein